ncbi:MAG: branched-chain amino acid ABC transporter permease [Rhizobiales bacterium 65-79]|jgi:branched-chain amino acid transport system permease protein|nr:branched-chain amino acid ABC transporter permease [Hyphomicrobiales bacterium]OJU03919.1 MAG: branched-chain amino acid ABC transporter permease [Rhizobiales bacterium 65-79]
MSRASDAPAAPVPDAGRGSFLAAYGIWIALAIVIAALPHIFSSGLALSMMSVMGTMIVFALSYNMLLGQTGLLSFGHAVFFGLGGFFAVHLMNALSGGEAPMPLIAFPLVGALAGLVFGIVVGAVATRRAGTAFAMITLGIGELVASSALILRSFFGGEEGISTDRTDLIQPFGLTFGPQIEVYYLIGAWCFVSMAAMYALTRTPFGRICNAVRENPERARFIGYNTQTVRFIAFSLSGLFAGIAGALAAINFEIMNSAQLGAAESGSVILMTYIGGIGNFAGPVIGAILVTYLQFTLSDITDVWQLYFGLLFIAVVMFAPNGIAGLLTLQEPLIRAGNLGRVSLYYPLAVVPALVALAGFSLMVEMTYRLSVGGSEMSFLYVPLNARAPLPWLAAIVLLGGGGWLFLRGARKVGQVYGDAVQEGLRR